MATSCGRTIASVSLAAANLGRFEIAAAGAGAEGGELAFSLSAEEEDCYGDDGEAYENGEGDYDVNVSR